MVKNIFTNRSFRNPHFLMGSVAVLVLRALFLSACFHGTSLKDAIAAESIESQEGKERFLDEFVFVHFEPEVEKHKGDLKECFQKVTFLSLRYGDEAPEGTDFNITSPLFIDDPEEPIEKDDEIAADEPFEPKSNEHEEEGGEPQTEEQEVVESEDEVVDNQENETAGSDVPENFAPQGDVPSQDFAQSDIVQEYNVNKDIKSSNEVHSVLLENILRKITECPDFEKMNLGNYESFSREVTNPKCRKSIFWEKFHFNKLSRRDVSKEEIQDTSKELVKCTQSVERDRESYRLRFPWFNWDCLDSLDVIELAALDFFDRNLFDGEDIVPLPVFLPPEILINNFVNCINLHELDRLLKGDKQSIFNRSKEFRQCALGKAKRERLAERFSDKTIQQLPIVADFLSEPIIDCFKQIQK